jgi:hypothetical protein
MNLNGYEQYVADLALGHLYGDDANPDVGWGLMQSTAIDYAIGDFKKAANLFAGGYDFALLQINRQNIEDYVREKRRR